MSTVKDIRTGNVVSQDVAYQVVQRQKGVARTNCVDCLDRTNIVQHLICHKVLSEHVSILKDLDKSWEDELIYLWAMAGDHISKEYSGTESVLTKIVLKGY